MYCSFCGKQIDGKEACFCQNCGAKLYHSPCNNKFVRCWRCLSNKRKKGILGYSIWLIVTFIVSSIITIDGGWYDFVEAFYFVLLSAFLVPALVFCVVKLFKYAKQK